MKQEEIRFVKDFPKAGINFLDIMSVLENPESFNEVITKLSDRISFHQDILEKQGKKLNGVLTTEARGFIFAAPVAWNLGLPLILIRKENKIPSHPYKFPISNEYTSYNMEVSADSFVKDGNYVIVDDVLATGASGNAINTALEKEFNINILSLCYVFDLMIMDPSQFDKKYLEKLESIYKVNTGE